MENGSTNSCFWCSHDRESFRFSRLLLTIFYSLLFMIGVPGNLWVASSMARMFSVGRRGSCASPIRRIQDQVKIYIFFLSIADLFVLIIIPLNVTDLWVGQWVFGHYLCKLYWVTESINRVLSGCFLATLAFDRFKSITMPWRKLGFLQTTRGAFILIFIVSVSVILLVAPSLVFAGIQRIPVLATNKTVPKCMESMPNSVITAFTTCLFCFGFLIPLLMIVGFNLKILLFVRFHTTTSTARTHVQLRRVVIKVLLTVLFHFVCLTPYWLFVLLGAYRGPHFQLLFRKYKFYINASLFIHALPSLNSAGNWIFYTLINKELRQELTCGSTLTSNVLSQGYYGAVGRRTSRFSEFGVTEPARSANHKLDRMHLKRRSEPIAVTAVVRGRRGLGSGDHL